MMKGDVADLKKFSKHLGSNEKRPTQFTIFVSIDYIAPLYTWKNKTMHYR